MTLRAKLHSTGPRVHYVLYVNEESRLSGPFRSKRAAQAAVDAANNVTHERRKKWLILRADGTVRNYACTADGTIWRTQDEMEETMRSLPADHVYIPAP